MIDTIRFRTNRKVTSIVFRQPGFQRLPGKPAIRVRVAQFGNRQLITAVETSLPKVLFGNNVRMLETEEEFERAFAELIDHLDQISTKDKFTLTRVDLGWNYKGRPLEFFLAHEHLNHPMVRKAIANYYDPRRNGRIVATRDNATRTGIEWQATKLRIRFYDKSKDAIKCGSKRPLLRVEIQLRGSLLRELLGGDETKPLHKLNWEDCYPVFRDILRRFPNPKVMPILNGRDTIYLAAIKAGIPVFDILGQGKNRSTVHRLRLRLGRQILRDYKVDWAWMLPDDFPPPKTVARPPAKPAKSFKLSTHRPAPPRLIRMAK